MEEKNFQNINSDSNKNIAMAVIAYIIFFVPLLTEAKNDKFVKYHVKQGLILFISIFVLNFIIYFLPLFLSLIVNFLYLGLFVLMIIGIIHASKGEQKPLPIIGKLGEKINF